MRPSANNSGGPLFDAEGRPGGHQFHVLLPLRRLYQHRLRHPGGRGPAGGRHPHPGRPGARGWLGAELQATETAARALGRQRGVLVTRVHADTPAERAGLQAGDLVIGIAGRPLADGGDLHRFLTAAAPGDRLELELWRQQQSRSVRVILGKQGKCRAPPPTWPPTTRPAAWAWCCRNCRPRAACASSPSRASPSRTGWTRETRSTAWTASRLKEIHDLNLALGRIPNREMGLLGIRRQGRAWCCPGAPAPRWAPPTRPPPASPRSTTDD